MIWGVGVRVRGDEMCRCKRCDSVSVVKNGQVRGKQRYKCKVCKYNFTIGDGRLNEALPAKKALAVLLYSLGKASFNMLGKLFGHAPSLIYGWIKEAGATLPDVGVADGIQEIEFDEMWHFLGSKKTNIGSLKPLIAVQDGLLPGLRVAVMLIPSADCTIRSNT